VDGSPCPLSGGSRKDIQSWIGRHRRLWIPAPCNPQRAILACFILLAVAYGLVVPPFENLDEVEHFEVVRYITETGRLPEHGSTAAEAYHYQQEASQPPLYHLLSAGLVQLLGLETEKAITSWHLNPCVACGPGAASLYDNRAVLYHDPDREAFPWRGTLLTLHALRLWSTLLQTVTLIGTYALAHTAIPQRPGVGLVAMAVVAFNPQFLLVASGVNNDNLVTPLVTLGLCLLLRTWRDGLSARRTIGLGVLTGLAGLTKLSGWLLLPLSATAILVLACRPIAPSTPSTTRRLPPAIGHVSLVVLTASAIGSWWFWRNWQLYQDPTALQPMLELVGTRGGSLFQSFLEAGAMFRSFWGQIPCSFYPPAFYVLYAVLTALAAGGLVRGWRRLALAEQAAAMILGSWFMLVVLSWMRWNAMTPAPGGRLLFPALPAVALLMALGTGELTRGRFELGKGIVIGLLALLAWWTVMRILPGFFAPPPRFPDASTIQPDQPLDATLGDSVGVRGYDIALNDDSRAPTLDVTLYWQALASMGEDYVMALQLVSPVAGDTTLRWNYNSWPGHGNYPTSAWRPGEVIVDRYRFRLPEADFPTQAWDVHMALYRRETGERLPARVQGSDAGDRLVLTQLRVPGIQPSCPEEGRMASSVRFGEAIALTHAMVVPEQEGVGVELCWEALQSLSADYTVFVHLRGASGEPFDTGDGPPMQGAFPTSMWHPGDTVLDVHRLMPISGKEEQGKSIVVGLYEPEGGSRLPASVGDVLVPDAAVQVWPNHP
jgi:4-amino-4-deoxy-L-arabinose transferase-like glycosyltransferase